MKYKMIRISIMVLVLSTFLFQNITNAQRQGQNQAPPIPDAEQIEKMLVDLKTKLELTDYQTEVIKKIYIKHFAEVEKIQGDKKTDKNEHRKQMDNLRKEFHKTVKAELTKDQQVLFDNHINNKQGPRPERKGQQRGKRR